MHTDGSNIEKAQLLIKSGANHLQETIIFGEKISHHKYQRR
ncbi:hypothetical protein SAMN04487897_14025 [Paenibacillus sp. yr247]|nr:hypothetical protein SAMN04487897_14025 [Paenibacillus sp. yr247]